MRVLKDTSIYILGEVISKSFPFFLLPYLTRSLGVGGFGELALSLMWLSILTVFIGMSQEGAISRYYFYRGKKYLSLVVGAGHILAALICIPIVVLAFLCSSTLVLSLTFAALFQSFLSVQLALRQCRKRAYSYFFVQFSSASLSLLFTYIIFESIAANADNRIFALMIANFLVVLISMINFLKESGTLFKISKIKIFIGVRYIFRYGFPLILHQLSFVVRGQLDRLFIYSQFSSYSLGVYSAGYQIASIYIVLLGAINTALMPYFFESLKKERVKESDLWAFVIKSLFFFPVPSFIAYCIPNAWYIMFLGEQFDSVKPLTCLFLLGMGLQVPYLILVNYMFYHGRNSKIGVCTMISSVVYIACVFIFSSYSLELVPLSLLFSNVISIVLLAREFKMMQKLKESK